MNGTRCAISPEMKATSRLSRSSFATQTVPLIRRACAGAAAERIRPFAGLGLDILAGQRHGLCGAEAGNRGALRVSPEAGPALTRS